MLLADEVSWSADGAVIVDGISLRVEPGSTVGLLGPNGSGKSSLLRLLAGLRRPLRGAVLLGGTDLREIGRRDLARRVAVVEQEVSTEIDLTVAEVVALGRLPHRSSWGGVRDGDHAAIADALRHTGLRPLADRRWHSLSGGERQRAQIARALAQQPSVVLADEPVASLDPPTANLVMRDLQRINHDLGITTVVNLHFLDLARRYADRIIGMRAGEIVFDGPAAEADDAVFEKIYGRSLTAEDVLA